MFKHNNLHAHCTETACIILLIFAEKVSESTRTCSDILAGAVSSAVILFLVISTIAFIAGFLCGNHFRVNFNILRENHIPQQIILNGAPEYEDIDAKLITRAVKHQEQGLELKENVAYGQSKSMLVEQL